ncbi:MAG: hypothetical protein DRG50_02945, partial [Deltaproteobacteria bacterium]
MEIDLFGLEVFAAVVEKGSFTEAAKSLHLTQPAITYKIKSLEETFALRLLKRGKTGVKLTPAGEILYRYAKRLSSTCAALTKEMEDYQRGMKDVISIGACPMVGEFILPSVCEAFCKGHPEVDLTIEISYFPPILEGLLSGDLDIGFLEIQASHKDIIVEEFLDEPFVLVVAAGFSPPQEGVSVEDFKKMRIFLRDEAVGIRAVLEEFFRKRGIRLKDLDVITVSGSNEAIKKMIKEGMGDSFFLKEAVKKDLETGRLKAVPLKD